MSSVQTVPRHSLPHTRLVKDGIKDDMALLLGQLGLFSIISTYPVHNPHTAYSVIMSAKTGDLVSFVRRAMCPENYFGDGVTVDSRYCVEPNHPNRTKH